MKRIIYAAIIVCCVWGGAAMAQEKIYVGSAACKECHEDEYEKFIRFSRKAHSYQSIKKMETRLTPEEFASCFECHTTGYGKSGGFVSEKETPGLMNAGCEVCHGPGSLHVDSQETEDIKVDLPVDDCLGCHNSDRVEVFDFKPLLFGGGH